jgi:phosphoribosylformylglycinamidine synthase
MRFGVVVFPGSNCDMDMVYVLEAIMKQKVVKLWHKDTNLQECDFIILPGGFSFGDYLRSGAIAKFSPIMKEVIGFANSGGYLMGICNGFQILCEIKILVLESPLMNRLCPHVYHWFNCNYQTFI